ncbi:maleylpyruvate isomerase family mycothiol-dependent enzyme [Actinomadura sp. ATCC 31491]|uniref:Maleylpyruvate isomerase family mycothiol-dependent enzyme n=1 Tax=Actinomadura luzonensis TaxID=2805427 RepID=A0ABT0FZI9_9ACTN|nr:maleylpyruvate isomerase family mycothiol-dependent enzyme [Actinomadura luzonensis]MCK2217694.1 maleylpyruvate isomerase family mycothiol-dependent enzyme [Actinomadura luzonensis]
MDYESLIERETERLAGLSGDLTVPVPTCPGWTTADLITHVGRLHRWTVHLLRNRVQEPLWSRQAPVELPEGGADPGWLRDGAAELVRVLRETDPAMEMWTWGPDRRASWWARRMAYELVVHRVDAELALGLDPVVPAEVAVDGVEELLHNLPSATWVTRPLAELGVEGATIHLHATDTATDTTTTATATDSEAEAEAGSGEWTITQGPAGRIDWARGHAKGDVAVRGPVADLLLLVYGRRSPDTLTVFGDRDLLTRWLAAASL